MSTDRELLEAAAKAAGLLDAEYEPGSELLAEALWSQKLFDEIGAGYWNPLTDDGDAFRLAVELGLDLLRTERDIEALAGLPPHVPMERDKPAPFGIELLGDDPAAATRRAIVRAAAQIGRKKGGAAA